MVVRMWDHTQFPLLQNIQTGFTWTCPLPTLSPPHPPPSPPHFNPLHSQTSHKQTYGTHGCLFACTHTHTAKMSKVPSEPPDEKTPPTQTSFAYAGRDPFILLDNVCVDFSLSAHFWALKAAERMAKKEKRNQEGMQPSPLTCSDLYKLSIPISNSQQFSIQQSCSGVWVCHHIFDEDMFERLVSLSFTCNLSHTRGISTFSDDDDDDEVLAVIQKWRGRWQAVASSRVWHESHLDGTDAKAGNWQTMSRVCLEGAKKNTHTSATIHSRQKSGGTSLQT